MIGLSGELDTTMCTELTDVLASELHRPGIIVVQADLNAVTFLDSSAISVLIGAYRTATATGRRFTISRPHGHVRRVLDVTGVLPTLSTESG
jgi:anti-anti-sigma factor